MRCLALAPAVVLAALSAPALAQDDGSMMDAPVVSTEAGEILVNASRQQVLDVVTPIGDQGAKASDKPETIKIRRHSQQELAPRAQVEITKRDPITELEIANDATVTTEVYNPMNERAVEEVRETAIISLQDKDADKAQSLGGTIKPGQMYKANNGVVYQYVGDLE